MELNVGDYARFDYHRISVPIQISKIKEKEFDKDEKYYLYLTDNGLVITGDNIIKSSPNIIDLIEENDLLKIEYFSLRYNERVTRLFEVDYMDDKFMCIKNSYCDFMLVNKEFNEDDKELNPIIKSVLTHEQFEAMQYVVGDN